MGSKDSYGALRIGDLVEVPEIRTVIQLEDLKDSNLRRMIVETFVLTSEVLNSLRSVFTCICGLEGRGIFLKGHFGSGKSHFLSILSALLRYPSFWAPLLLQSPSLRDFEQELKKFHFLVAEISLVQHRGSEFLEDIILHAILEELGEDMASRLDGSETRHDAFRKIKTVMEDRGFRGMVLVIDELSEFLRSKSDARVFNEDIRFLQYLGEEAGAFPLWVVASLQEWIEETGEIHQDSFNKIKDRYRVRLNLGRAHIEELVSERLIRHREGAESRINEIYEKLKSYFPTFPVTLDRFIRLYPVHPGTSTLLDRLKPLFSEHRGVVDFIHFRLKGDPERGIPSMLGLPADQLLTPEVIFDHFLDRIRERSETQVFVERVFENYRDEIPELFQEEEQRKIALVLVKLLILFTISPVKFRYTVRHMAEMLLFQVTSMETEVNYQFILYILDRLEKEGSYIRVEKRDDPFDNHYFIDLKADMAGIMRKKIRHMASRIFPEDRRLFWKIAHLVDSPYLPLGRWVDGGRQSLTVEWQHTRRSGALLLRQLDELSQTEIRGLARQWADGEEDFFLLVGTSYNRDQQYQHVRDVLLPHIQKENRGIFLFWIPAALEGDSVWLRELLATILLLEGAGQESKERKGAGEDFFRALIERERSRVTEHFTRCYYHGTLIWDENQIDLSRYGHLSQEKFLAEFIPPLMDRRFPKHSRVQPYMDALFPGILKDMLMDFLSSGMLIVDDRSKFGIRDILEGLLKPMGLVRKKGNLYELHVNPKQNELAGYFFDRMGDRESVSVEEMYRAFRKGEYGLMQPHFEIFVLALLFSGHLVAYRVMNRKNPEEIARTGLKGITALSRGEILEEDFRQVMIDHPLIPQKFKNIPFTLATQEELWSYFRSQKPAALEDLEALKSKIQWAGSFEAFKRMPWEALKKDIEQTIAHWEEIKVSLPSKEGLERFLRLGGQDPFLDKRLNAILEARHFLDQAERTLFVYQYVTDQRLHVSDEEMYVQKDYDRAKGVREGMNLQRDYGALEQARQEILEYFRGTSSTLSSEDLEELFGRFQVFQQNYLRAYSDAHQKARGGSQFEPYEQLTHSKRYRLLQRLDQLEMISVEHNRRSIDQGLSSVLVHRCLRSPRDHLQSQPVCSCGYRLGESTFFKPLREIEKEMDLGISETLDALKSPAIQERIIPYQEGLDHVGKKDEADAIRKLLGLSNQEDNFLERLERLLTPSVIRNINEAFRGKVVVVKRDLDRLYQSLIHRKYTLLQLRNILREWLQEEGLSEDTFLHFVGTGSRVSAAGSEDPFREFLESEYGHLASLYRNMGHDRFVRAIIIAHWAGQYDLPVPKTLDLFPSYDFGEEEKREKLIEQLATMAGILHAEKPELFELLISELEEDSTFIKTLWSSLSSFSPEETFKKETCFSRILQEAFERLLSDNLDKRLIEELTASGKSSSGEGPIFRQRKEEMLLALEIYNLFKQKSSALKTPKTSGPEAFSRWESMFVQTLSPIPCLKERIYEKLKRIGVTVPPFMKQDIKALIGSLQEITEAFTGFYRHALPIWEGGEGPRPWLIQDIPSLLLKKRGVPDHRKVRYILMDGMRWDLWEQIKKDFFGKRPDAFRVVKEGILWANQPSDTAAQLDRFNQEFNRAYGNMGEEDLLWRINGIDEKIHTEKGPLLHLFASIISYLEIDFLYRLVELPPRTLLILFSDHGFVENPNFRAVAKYDAPRYIHGKDSPFEVLIPWAWLMRI